MALFITVGLGSTLVSRMVLNLRSWSQRSDHFGDDAGWRFDSSDAVLRSLSHAEMHNMMERATRRQSKDIAPTGGLGVSVHIEGPRRPTYCDVNMPSQQGIAVETETVIIAEDDHHHASKMGC